MSKIAGASKTLGEIAEKGTIAGIVMEAVEAGKHIASGNATWKDGVTIGAAVLGGVAMYTGVGEVAVGIGTVAWDIYKLITEKK
jgi:hypothetical protein